MRQYTDREGKQLTKNRLQSVWKSIEASEWNPSGRGIPWNGRMGIFLRKGWRDSFF